jgi:hypothetical protein
MHFLQEVRSPVELHLKKVTTFGVVNRSMLLHISHDLLFVCSWLPFLKLFGGHFKLRRSPPTHSLLFGQADFH